MQALVVPDFVLTQVKRLLFIFLWRKKDCNRKAFEKVKRNVLCCDLENGGHSMIGLKQMQTAQACGPGFRSHTDEQIIIQIFVAKERL